MRHISLFALSLVAVVSATASSQSKPALTHETLMSFKRVGAPVPSPDGKWVVFPVGEVTYDPAQDVSDLWIVPADGSAKPRRLTSNKGGESGPSWSPDSTRLAFTARRDGDEVSQVYVLDVSHGGEAQRVTNAPTATAAPKWSPDGTKLIFHAPMWAGATDEESNRRAAAERRGAKSKVRIYETFPIRNFDVWLDDAKPHVWVVTVEGDRKSRSLIGGTKFAAARGFSSDTPGATWTPDGQSVLFVATDRVDSSARAVVTSHIYQVPIAGGEPKQITPNTVDAGAPDFSPDGKMVCFPASDPAPAIYHLTRLGCAGWSAAPSTLTVNVITKDFDRSVNSWAFTPDGKTIYLTAEDKGHELVYSVPTSGGSATMFWGQTGVFTNLQIPKKAPNAKLFGNFGAANRPTEVARVDVPAGPNGWHALLSSSNSDVAQALDWPELREFTFTNRNGREIHNFIALPPNFDPARKYPLFVLIHGGHANMWRDEITYRWNYHLLAQPNFVILMTDYRGSTGYGEKFTLDILGDPLKGPADDINDAADEAIKRFSYIDGTRQCAGGASYGGHLANWLEGTTTRYKCLVSHAGLATLDGQWGMSDGIYHRELMMGGPYWENPAKWNEQSPIAKAGSFKTPMLLSVGELDYRVPHGNTLTMYSALQRMNVPVKLMVWPDENHWILKGENSRVFYREVRAWLEKYLK